MIVWRTVSDAASRSTSAHRRPSTSPRRIPVIAARCHAPSSRVPATDARKTRSCSGVQNRSSVGAVFDGFGGRARSAGFTPSRPSSTASASALCRIVCRYRTVFALNPPPSPLRRPDASSSP